MAELAEGLTDAWTGDLISRTISDRGEVLDSVLPKLWTHPFGNESTATRA